VGFSYSRVFNLISNSLKNEHVYNEKYVNDLFETNKDIFIKSITQFQGAIDGRSYLDYWQNTCEEMAVSEFQDCSHLEQSVVHLYVLIISEVNLQFGLNLVTKGIIFGLIKQIVNARDNELF
jgi:hypothetical protein